MTRRGLVPLPARGCRWAFLCGLALIAGACGSSSRPASRPPSPPPRGGEVEQGISLYEQGRFREALDVLGRTVGVRPGDARAWAYLGLTKIALERPAEAMSDLERALELDRNFAPTHYGLGLAHGYLDRLDQAIAELEIAVRLDPNHAYAHYHLGLAYNEKKRTDRALTHLERFLELAPDAPEAPQVRKLLSQLR